MAELMAPNTGPDTMNSSLLVLCLHRKERPHPVNMPGQREADSAVEEGVVLPGYQVGGAGHDQFVCLAPRSGRKQLLLRDSGKSSP